MLKSTLEFALVIVLGLSSSGTSAVGLAAGLSETGGGNTLTGNTLIPLGLFLAGIAMTSAMVWGIATHKSRIENDLRDLKRRIRDLEKTDSG